MNFLLCRITNPRVFIDKTEKKCYNDFVFVFWG